MFHLQPLDHLCIRDFLLAEDVQQVVNEAEACV